MGHNTFYNSGYNSKGDKAGISSVSGGKPVHASSMEQRSNSVKVSGASRLARDVTSALSP